MSFLRRLIGERPIPGVHGVIVGQTRRRRGQSAVLVVTHIDSEGVVWGRPNGLHDSAAAALEVAHDDCGRTSEADLVGHLVRDFALSEESAAQIVAAARHQRQSR